VACGSCETLDAEQWLAHVRAAGTGLACRGQIVHEARIRPRQARCRAPETSLDPRVGGAPRTVPGVPGMQALYVHQADCIDAVVGQWVPLAVVSTPTASGKSLCYVLPLLQLLCESVPGRHCNPGVPDQGTRPGPAPQPATLRGRPESRLLEDASHAVACYDGGTPALEREDARDAARVLVTNPDMLHRGVLPKRQGFRRLLQHLRLVVVWTRRTCAWVPLAAMRTSCFDAGGDRNEDMQ